MPLPIVLLATGVAVAICAGIRTPVCCTLAIFAQLNCAFLLESPLIPQTMIAILQTVALLLLGPGAYSVDGKRYGRRVVILPGQNARASQSNRRSR